MAVESGGSLKERVAKIRQQREQVRTFVIPVRGYEAVGLCARYRVLSFEEIAKINQKLLDEREGPEKDLLRFADTLIVACEELLVRRGTGSYQALGCKWTSQGVEEHLGVEVPEGGGARGALRAVLNGVSGGSDLALHFAAYDEEFSKVAAEVDEEVKGESEAGSDAS